MTTAVYISWLFSCVSVCREGLQQPLRAAAHRPAALQAVLRHSARAETLCEVPWCRGKKTRRVCGQYLSLPGSLRVVSQNTGFHVWNEACGWEWGRRVEVSRTCVCVRMKKLEVRKGFLFGPKLKSSSGETPPSPFTSPNLFRLSSKPWEKRQCWDKENKFIKRQWLWETEQSVQIRCVAVEVLWQPVCPPAASWETEFTEPFPSVSSAAQMSSQKQNQKEPFNRHRHTVDVWWTHHSVWSD